MSAWYGAFRQRWYATPLLLAVIFVGLAVLPYVLDVNLFGAGLKTVFSVHILVITLVWAYTAQAWNIVEGYVGQFSLGHAAFFGLGAYVPVLLIHEFTLNPWVGMLIGGVVAAGYGGLIGALCFRYRLSGNYFTLATLAFSELLRHVFVNAQELGGASGYVRPLPAAYATGYGLAAFQFRDTLPYYYVILAFLVVVTLVSLVIKQSRLGLHLFAIRDNEAAATAIGIPTFRYKVTALAVSAFFTAWAGSFWSMYFASIRPNVVFDVLTNVDILLPAIVGGIGTVVGPIVGSIVLTAASELARHGFDVAGLENLVYGLILIGVILYTPAGLVSWPRRTMDSIDSPEPRTGAASDDR
ncbi:MAG: branched-chain amino acid ABC transporter permease [Halobacteriales archaeon]